MLDHPSNSQLLLVEEDQFSPGGPPHDHFGQHSGVQFGVPLLSPWDQRWMVVDPLEEPSVEPGNPAVEDDLLLKWKAGKLHFPIPNLIPDVKAPSAP